MPRHPKYQLIAEELRDSITSGVYEPGQQLPNLRELAETYGTSTRPPRTAIRALRDEGLVVVNGHIGAYVAAAQETRPV